MAADETPEPSWAVFGPCERRGCRAKSGAPCVFGPRSYRRGEPLKNPHPGRARLAKDGA